MPTRKLICKNIETKNKYSELYTDIVKTEKNI